MPGLDEPPLRLVRREDANPVIAALKRGQPLHLTGVSQTRLRVMSFDPLPTCDRPTE